MPGYDCSVILESWTSTVGSTTIGKDLGHHNQTKIVLEIVNVHVLVEKYKPDPSQILSFCLCNFDQVVIVRSTLCKIYFPLRVNPKIQRKNQLSPSLCNPIFWLLMNFFQIIPSMGGMPHPDHQMTQWKRILLCWDLMEGSDVQVWVK